CHISSANSNSGRQLPTNLHGGTRSGNPANASTSSPLVHAALRKHSMQNSSHWGTTVQDPVGLVVTSRQTGPAYLRQISTPGSQRACWFASPTRPYVQKTTFLS